MKIYKAAIIGLGPSGLAVNKLIYDKNKIEIIAFDNSNINQRNNFFGFWLTNWMRPYEKLISKKWNNWIISNNKKKITHNDNKTPYCVISFQNWKKFCLDTSNKLNIQNKKVIQYIKVNNYFKIITEDKSEYYAEKIYDSRSDKQKDDELLQHFFGINITTANKTFDEKKLTLMHFTKEDNIIHFIYLLPFTDKNALIESTVFSKHTLSEDWYRDKISKYLKEFKITEFEENSIEKGIIPMFFNEEKIPKDPNIFNIGIRGGACKPSTGYAFSFSIKQIQFLKETNRNNISVHSFIEKKMDKIFLNYLKNNYEDGRSFIKLAENLNGNEFQSFMMGKSSIFTKLKIIKSMPKLKFIKSLFN